MRPPALSLATVTLIASVMPSAFPQSSTPPAVAAAWMPVRTDGMAFSLESFSAEEKIEQMRDWSLLSALVTLNPGERAYRDLLFRFVPVRLDHLAPLFNQRVGSARWLPAGSGNLLVVVPEGSGRDLLALGRVADEFRAATGNMPKQVIVFEYGTGKGGRELAIRRVEDVAGASLYTAVAGYFQASVRDQQGLSAFLAQNLDLVSANPSFADGGVVGT